MCPDSPDIPLEGMKVSTQREAEWRDTGALMGSETLNLWDSKADGMHFLSLFTLVPINHPFSLSYYNWGHLPFTNRCLKTKNKHFIKGHRTN